MSLVGLIISICLFVCLFEEFRDASFGRTLYHTSRRSLCLLHRVFIGTDDTLCLFSCVATVRIVITVVLMLLLVCECIFALTATGAIRCDVSLHLCAIVDFMSVSLKRSRHHLNKSGCENSELFY